MNTASKSSAKQLLISDANTLDPNTYGSIISPLAETTTSSSTATIESTTAQISSKSSSPFNALSYKESPKQSPRSETNVSNSPPGSVGAAAINKPQHGVAKSPISPATCKSNSPPTTLPAFGSRQQLSCDKDDSTDATSSNMLPASTSTGSASSSQQSGGANSVGGASLMSGSQAASPNPASIKNIKCEPFANLSPLNENTNSQQLLEEGPPSGGSNHSGSANVNNNNNIAIDSSNIKRESAATPTSTMLRQNSTNSSLNAVTSPQNSASEHSNSSNSSSSNSVPLPETSSAEMLQDLPQSGEKSGKKKGQGHTVKAESENALNSPTEKPQSAGTSSASTSGPTGGLPAVKEEPDMLKNLINIKKEESNLSPDMSPVGFGSMPSLSGNSGVDSSARACTPVKLNDLPGSSCNSNSNTSNNNNNTSNSEKLNSGLGCPNKIDDDVNSAPPSHTAASAPDNCANSAPVNALNNNNNNGGGGNGGSSSSSGGPLGNCMEYMQQQNHIFVFSTQLANKGAESVMSGQFPTIIAYHCTQPATKSFLEDFFMKNPIKMSKLQRQNNFNLCNISVGGQQWLGGGGLSGAAMSKLQSKANNNKMNFSGVGMDGSKVGGIRGGPGGNMPAFGDAADALGPESELMCWEQTRSNLENADAIKMPDNVDQLVGGTGHGATAKSLCSSDGDGGTPSLQGIKVPDENLTPQQRQHREEQLAKLKKLDQLFSNPQSAANQLSKLGAGAGNAPDGTNIAGLMLNMPGASGPGSGGGGSGGMGIRNMPPHGDLNEGPLVPPDMLGSHDLNALPCNAPKPPNAPNLNMGNQPNMPCGGVMAPNVGNMPCGLLPNSPEVLTNFGQQNCDGGNLNGGKSLVSLDMNQVGMAQMEWTKLTHQYFEERMKGQKPNTMNEMQRHAAAGMTSGVVNINAPNVRQNLNANAPSGPGGGAQALRNSQGPPPPYHPTQRSASVPIATQSPNPASPNNPTSNLSLPSPRTTGALGISANSPNMDVHVSSMSAASTTSITSVITATAGNSSNNSIVNSNAKISFAAEGSPNGGNNGGQGGNGGSAAGSGNNRNNRSNLNQFNSNPSTPLAHMSPKDLDSFHPNTGSGTTSDLKNARPSPQRARTPLIGPNAGNMPETGSMEGGRFPNASPGVNFSPHLQNAPGGGPVGNYKAGVPLERQNSAPLSSQFCRRADNLPLNPNSNRPPSNKLNHSFDPISSLAQMSQQLTSCVSLNAGGGVGNSPAGMGVIGVNDMNMPNSVNPNLDGVLSAMDAGGGMEHCNSGNAGNMGMPAHLGGGAPFLSNNCHINPMLGPMGQRLLNPKMCGGFNPAANGGMREPPGPLHGVMPSHRMMSRMPVNFGNFNVPNIQVKASTPNTIQYMPVRPQGNNPANSGSNPNNNMRVPPSLEFLRNYANPQLAGGGGAGGNVLDNGPNGDSNKMVNCGAPSGGGTAGNMNFFGNCNQMGGGPGGGGGGGGSEQDEMAAANAMHEMNMGPLIRGMRPMRQHSIPHAGNQVLGGPRMQAPGGGGAQNMGGGMLPGQFPGAPGDAMECSDSGMFVVGNAPGSGGGPGPNAAQMFAGGAPGNSHKPLKGMNPAGGMCPSMSGSGGSGGPGGGQVPNAGILQNEHSPVMQSGPVNGPMLMGPNSGMLPNNMNVGNNPGNVGCAAPGGPPGGNINYKSFVGPAANDLKYAQQYHSFQQQLYATSTRSQGGSGNVNMGNNGANPSFFVNK